MKVKSVAQGVLVGLLVLAVYTGVRFSERYLSVAQSLAAFRMEIVDVREFVQEDTTYALVRANVTHGGPLPIDILSLHYRLHLDQQYVWGEHVDHRREPVEMLPGSTRGLTVTIELPGHVEPLLEREGGAWLVVIEGRRELPYVGIQLFRETGVVPR